MAFIIMFGAVMLVGVFEMVVRYQQQIREIDRMIIQDSKPIEP